MNTLTHSPQRTLALLLVAGLLWTTGQPVVAAANKQKSAKPDKPPATQTIELGNVGEKASVNIKQIQGAEPKVLAKVVAMLARRDADARRSEQRLAELEAELQKARASGVGRVLSQAAQPEADDLAKRARDALLKGESALAEQLLRQQEERAAGASEAKRHEAAQLAREIAALAIGRDSLTSLAALERAAKYEPEDFWTLLQLGDTQAVLGRSAPAMASYKAAHAIAETLAARDPANTQWQRDLSVSHNRIGDVLVAQGDLAGALAAYRKGLAIAEALAARDAANTEWQRDLSVSHDKIGNVRVAQGDLAGALAAYRQSLEIREALAAHDAANTGWQRDLSVSHERIGDVRMAQGDLAGALAAYRQSLDIAEALAARDPANTGWQTDVAVSCAKLGMHAGIPVDERRGYLRRGLEILQGLKSRGRLPPNQDWIGGFEKQLAALDREG